MNATYKKMVKMAMTTVMAGGIMMMEQSAMAAPTQPQVHVDSATKDMPGHVASKILDVKADKTEVGLISNVVYEQVPSRGYANVPMQMDILQPKTKEKKPAILFVTGGGFINANKTMRYSDTDWLDEISRTGFSQNYDLSISNATDKYSAMFSLGYKKNNGILKYTSFENIAARINTSYNINKILKVGENFTLTWSRQVDSAPMENALKMPPIVPVYETDGKTFAGPVGSMSDRQNPLRQMYDNRDNHLDYWRLFGNAYVELKPIKGLTLRSSFGIDFYTSFIQSLTPSIPTV